MAKKDKKNKKKGHPAAVVTTLQRQQANALVAYLNYKKYHWLSYGFMYPLSWIAIPVYSIGVLVLIGAMIAGIGTL